MPVQPLLRGLEWPRMTSACAGLSAQSNNCIRNFPAISPELKALHAKRLGIAGEYLCDSILLRIGFDPLPAPEHLPYDRSVQLDDGQIIRLQIKVRLSPSTYGYNFRVGHGNPRQGEGVRPYQQNAFDMLGLVILEENVIRFSANAARHQTIHFSEISGLRRAPGRSFTAALGEIRQRRSAHDQTSPSTAATIE